MHVYYRFSVLEVNVETQSISEILQKTILEKNFLSVAVGRKKKFAMLKTCPRLSCCRRRKRDFYEIRRDPVDSEPAERTTFVFTSAGIRINSLAQSYRGIILYKCSKLANEIFS